MIWGDTGGARTCLAEPFGCTICVDKVFVSDSSDTLICWNDTKHVFSEQL